MRIGRSEIEANPDGIALGGAVLEALALAGQISRRSLADPTSRAFRSGTDRYRAILEQTSSYLWVTTPGNSRPDQIAGGRAYVRANLAAAASGVTCIRSVKLCRSSRRWLLSLTLSTLASASTHRSGFRCSRGWATLPRLMPPRAGR